MLAILVAGVLRILDVVAEIIELMYLDLRDLCVHLEFKLNTHLYGPKWAARNYAAWYQNQFD